MKFHINSAGNVGECSATSGNCPFGSEDDHYPTVGMALAVYEEEQGGSFDPARRAASNLSAGAMRQAGEDARLLDGPLPLRELNQAVKSTTHEEIIKQALESGSERTLANMARNRNLAPEYLLAAYKKAQEPATLSALAHNENFPLAKASARDFAAVYRASRGSFLRSKAIQDLPDVSDAQLKELSFEEKLPFIRNGANKVSVNAVRAVVKEGKYGYGAVEAALASGKFKVRDHMDDLTAASVRPVVDKVTDEKDLEAMGDLAIAESAASMGETGRTSADAEMVKWLVARNPKTLPSTLALMVEHGSHTDVLMSAYRNPNAEESTKAAAMAKSSVVASFAKVEEIKARVPGGDLGAYIRKDSGSRPNYTSTSRSISFDPEKVKELGMTAADVDAYVRYHVGNHLFSAKYNEGSGAYTGYID